MNKVLVLTHEEDPHSQSVCNYLKNKGIDLFEVLTDKIITDYSLTFDLSRGTFLISDGRRTEKIDESWSIWNRRVMDPVLPKNIPKELEDIVFTETERTWQSLLFSHKGKVVNRPQANFNANNKLDQLIFVNEYGNGIKTPKTVLTNDPACFLSFYSSTPVVSFKLLKAPIVKTGEDEDSYFTCYNNIVSEGHLKNAKLVRNNPSLFQEYIDKEYELRVTALEDKVVGIRIDSQSSNLSKVDFRRYDFENVKYSYEDLPDNVTRFCHDIINHYGLSFAELDLIRDKNGDYVFLELNPNGQWLWLELKSGYDLTKDVAENLL